MMVSACINNVGMSPESLLDCGAGYPSHGWLSPRISFSRDMMDEGCKNGGERRDQVDSVMDFVDFEFRLSDPVGMLSADELFSNGKLVPLHLAPIQTAADLPAVIRSPGTTRCRVSEEMAVHDCYAFSPKAPKCSSRWKEMLGLKKAQNREAEQVKAAAPSLKLCNPKPLKHYLIRNPRSSSQIDSTICCPLLRDSDPESVSISARVSLSSSSSSGADHEDLPRVSLDLDRITSNPPSLPPRSKVVKVRPHAIHRSSELSAEGNGAMRINPNPFRRAPGSAVEANVARRVGRNPMHLPAESSDLASPLGSSVDSPRLNASGKVIFQGLGRSSSSPNFTGGPKPRPRGMERSYSANVRVTPVLNVPICNLRSTAKSVSAFSFGQIFPQRREKENPTAAKICTTRNFHGTKT